MEQRCAERGARLLDFVVDLGAVPGSADEYPALSYLRKGQADVLLVIRVPVFGSQPSGDRLEALAMPAGRAVAWLTAPALRRLGLLPAAVRAPGMARQRAEELRDKCFPFAAIARWLDSEGYAAPDSRREHWRGTDVAKLLRPAAGRGGIGALGSAAGEAAGLS